MKQYAWACMHSINCTLTLTGLQPVSPRVFLVFLQVASLPVPSTIVTAATELAFRIDPAFGARAGANNRGGGGGGVVHNDVCRKKQRMGERNSEIHVPRQQPRMSA